MKKLLCLLFVVLSAFSFAFGCGALNEHELEFVDLYVTYASEEALFGEIENLIVYEDDDDGAVAYIKCINEMEETNFTILLWKP